MNTSRLQKTIYIPYMCDHGYAVAAALEAEGLTVEALPPPDDESLEIGLDLCRGRECLPCFTTTGDIIRRARQPGFDPARAIMMIPSTTGLCRFGQYKILQQHLLEDEGFGEVEIVSPDANNGYQGFGDNPTRLRKLAWQGIVAIDLLQKLLHEYRPYELEAGTTDQLYQDCLADVLDATRAGGGKRLIAALKRMAGRFESLAVDRSERRPLIGLVGEIYLRVNEFTNQQIIRRIEAAGGEVVMATLMEWMYFTNWICSGRAWQLGQYGNLFSALLCDVYQKYEEHRLIKPVEHLLRDPRETPMVEVMRNLQPHYEPVMGLETEAGLSLGKAVEFARKGLCGIVNVMPFSCMPGIVVAGMAPRFRASLNNIPWLDLSFSAQGGTNTNTRLEAFMYQAKQYQRQLGRLPVPAGV